MTIMQNILAGRGLIPPTIPVNGLAFSDTDSQTYPGNGVFYQKSNDTFVVPNNWQTKTWRYTAQMTSTASYTCAGFSITLYKNGVVVASWSQSADQNGYFRYNSGTLTYTYDLTLEAGDTVQAVLGWVGRNVGGSTPTATNYHELKRLT